jgi:hypothetical protein
MARELGHFSGFLPRVPAIHACSRAISRPKKSQSLRTSRPSKWSAWLRPSIDRLSRMRTPRSIAAQLSPGAGLSAAATNQEKY